MKKLAIRGLCLTLGLCVLVAGCGGSAIPSSSPPTPQLITEYLLPGAFPNPMGITAGPDGNLWFADNGESGIGRITPGGIVTTFPLPLPPEEGPLDITLGPDGNLWFTEVAPPNFIGKISPTGAVTKFPIPTAFGFPWGITAGPDGNLWFTENVGATGNGAIGRITELKIASRRTCILREAAA